MNSSFKLKRNIKKIISRLTGKPGFAKKIGAINFETRDSWLKQVLESLPSGLKILDAGAGECQYKKYCNHLEYTSQDFGQYDGKGDNVGMQTQEWDNSKIDIIGDICDIPVDSASFDIVMCTEVLEHVPDPINALRELNRVLKVGGRLIVTAPFNSLTHFAPYHFFSGFNQYFYQDWCIKNNYEIIQLVPNGNYFNFLAQEIRRVNSVLEKYANRKLSSDELQVLDSTLLILDNFENEYSSAELLCFGYHLLAQKK